MCKNTDLTFDQFMLEYVNNKKSFKFVASGLTLNFHYKDNVPVLEVDDGSFSKQIVFSSPFEICRLSFNGTPFSALFKKVSVVEESKK